MGARRNAAAMLFLVLTFCGCDHGPELVPLQGRVLLQGKPLKFGGVMFQPPAGQPARGTINPDGSFVLTTIEPGDGATSGLNRIRVTCYEAQRPGAKESNAGREATLGKPLIPEKYSDYDTSGLTIDVRPGLEQPVVLELKSNSPGGD